MPTIRQRLVELSHECEVECKRIGFVGKQTGEPNFRLIYTSVETYERGNGFVIIGLNPSGSRADADADDRNRPFREEGYSAYLDDDFQDNGVGGSDFQRAVQGIAMIVTGATPSQAISAMKSSTPSVEKRIGTNATDFLRSTPSMNIIPFRESDSKKIPQELRQRGTEIGWELLCLMQPKPNYIITLSNSMTGPIWQTILRGSCQTSESFEAVVHSTMKRTYREAYLPKGPLARTTLIGLPAVVRDKGREDVTRPLFRVVSSRIRHHGIPPRRESSRERS